MGTTALSKRLPKLACVASGPDEHVCMYDKGQKASRLIDAFGGTNPLWVQLARFEVDFSVLSGIHIRVGANLCNLNML